MQQRQIAFAAENTLEGHQRAILGQLTVEEVFQDREKFANEVTEVAAKDIASMGYAVEERALCSSRARTDAHYWLGDFSFQSRDHFLHDQGRV